jgi:hypothetical protein
MAFPVFCLEKKIGRRQVIEQSEIRGNAYFFQKEYRNIIETIDSFVKFFQFRISPIVLISGVGLLLLSLTNRLARTIDKSRMIVTELENEPVADKDKKRWK